jgi:CheY-like chemotaxis protein
LTSGGPAPTIVAHRHVLTAPLPLSGIGLPVKPAPLRVLVAEDDDMLREIVCAGLADHGFDVVSAPDGAAALRLFESAGPYDALLLDEEMPYMTGRQLLARLRHAGERVAALLMSGHLEMDDRERARLDVGPVLRKPVSIRDISAAIRRAVDARASA